MADFRPPHPPHDRANCRLFLEQWPEKRLRWKINTSAATLLLVVLPLFNMITYVHILQEAFNSQKTIFEGPGRIAGAMLSMTTILYVICPIAGLYGVWKGRPAWVMIFIASLMMSSFLYLSNAVVQIISDTGFSAGFSFLIVLHNLLLIVALQKLIRRMETCWICY